MKIAITGTSGTGKSTLAHALAGRLGIGLIEENFETLQDARLKIDFPPRIIKILENKSRQEDQLSSFVSDRCPVDLINLWLSQSCHKINRPLSEAFLKQCIDRIKTYDFLVLTAWNSIPLRQNHHTLRRNMDNLEQLRYHAALTGHVHMWTPKDRIIELPQRIASLEERVEFVCSAIQKRQQTSPCGAC